MDYNLLKINGLSKEILDLLSYESRLGVSLKKNLHYFNKRELMHELEQMVYWLDEQEIFSNIAVDYRIKSIDSIALKYDRYFPNHQVRKVFNDVLGFRALCDSYDLVDNKEERDFRIVDMTSGKVDDDGYRGVHVYYQMSNKHYPIEIQFNTLYDRQLNNWLHDYLYKREYPSHIGRELRERYEKGFIKNEEEFRRELAHVLSNSKG